MKQNTLSVMKTLSVRLAVLALCCFGFASAVSAETVFESGPIVDAITLDFTCGTSQCRNELPYQMYGEHLPSGQTFLSFDRIRMFFATSTPQRVIVYAIRDGGSLLGTCAEDDSACWHALNISTPQYNLTTTPDNTMTVVATSSTGSTQEMVFASTFTGSSSDWVIYVSIDPNSPFQISSPAISLDGYHVDGYDHDGGTLGYAYQLCLTTCDDFGFTHRASLGMPDGNFFTDRMTRFTSLDVAGTSTLSLSAGFWIEESEVDRTDPTKNPTHVRFTYALNTPGSTNQSALSDLIGEVVATGTASVDVSGLDDGYYDLRVDFSNVDCIFDSRYCPFPNVYGYMQFEVGGGALVSTSTVNFSDGTEAPAEAATVYDFMDKIVSVYSNVLETKMPFAWITLTLEYLDAAVLTIGEYSDYTITLDIMPNVSHATTSDTYFDFYSLKQSLNGATTTISFAPIVESCTFLEGTGTDYCAGFRSITTYLLYLGYILFLGKLFMQFFITPPSTTD